jgi:hypothetical protein
MLLRLWLDAWAAQNCDARCSVGYEIDLDLLWRREQLECLLLKLRNIYRDLGVQRNQ